MSSGATSRRRIEMGWLWILLIVLLVVALLGGFGYARR
jgi:flagellar basal body-associated protein FliL